MILRSLMILKICFSFVFLFYIFFFYFVFFNFINLFILFIKKVILNF